jgi:hypothetical protein
MFLRLLETTLILYCVVSYFICTVFLWTNWGNQNDPFNKETSKGHQVLVTIIFMTLAPLVVLEVIIRLIRGENSTGVS